MHIPFYKYQGTGNDFVLIDNREMLLSNPSADFIAHCCDRKFGIGADGLMLLQTKEGYDFEMIYYNANGQLGSMCGNGGRCVTAFANFLGILKNNHAYFLAVDGPHDAKVIAADYIELKMTDTQSTPYNPNYIFLDTGSPHHIEFIPQIEGFDVYNKGKAIRYNDIYKEKGTNVNFVEVLDNQHIKVATYERGVEDETLSCGTGVTAAAIAYQLAFGKNKLQSPINIETKGGVLQVRFQQKEALFFDIWLCGPATSVFSGTIEYSF